MWIRSEGAFEAIVDRTTFDAAQAIIHARSLRLSDEEMIKALQQLLQDRGYRVVNVDATVIAERPRLGRYRDAMRANIGLDLGLDAARVNVKATTTEGLGYIGRGEGLACQAIVLIEQTTGIQTP